MDAPNGPIATRSATSPIFLTHHPSGIPPSSESTRRAGNRSARGLGRPGSRPFGLGADGVEVHEPRLEKRPRHRLQRLVHPPVQFDLVVQRAEDVGDGALFGEWRDAQLEVGDIRAPQTVEQRAHVEKLADLLPPFRPSNNPAKEGGKDLCSVGAKENKVLA